MKKLTSTGIGRLRLLGILEGISTLVLLFIAMPAKYMLGRPELVRSVGMIHGILFLLFVGMTILVAERQNWRFWKITWKILLASVVPFATFYVDAAILKKLDEEQVKPV
jgi:integral membrane protein